MKRMLQQELTEDREGRSSPLVSILIINWNGKAHIEECLHSCLNSRYPNYEIIVIDNNSSDDSAGIVKSKFREVQLVELGQNLGFAGATNVGIGVSRGSYVAVLCSDITVDTKWLSNLVQAMTDPNQSCSSGIGIAGGITYYSPPGDVIWGGPGKIDMTTGSTWQPDGFRKTVRDTADADYIAGGAIVVKKEVFENIGTFDGGYFLYSEDVDFCMRALRAGYRLKIVPGARAWHLMSMNNELSLKAYYLRACSRIRLYFKNFPLRFLFSAVLFQVLIRPIFEVIWFRQHPACLLLSVSALRVNLFKLRQTLVSRSQVEALGRCKAKSRLKDLVMIALDRLSSKGHYRY